MKLGLISAFAETNAPLRISTTPMPVGAPMLLARELGLFEKAGLRVVIKEYPLGKTALEDLSRQELDLAAAAVTPLVYRSLAGKDFRIIANIGSSSSMVAMAARKDHGIAAVADFAGKSIGITAGTSGEFFFDTLRVLHRISKDSVRVEDRTVDGLLAGLQDGSLDVISIWEPQISQLKRALPGKLNLFYGSGLYTFSWNLVALPETIQSRRADIEKLVAVLFQAAEYIQDEPDGAEQILTQRFGEKGRDLADHLDEATFLPNLNQTLLVQLEAETRWIMARDAKTNAVPNYLRSIDASILKKVRPAAVTLIQ